MKRELRDKWVAALRSGKYEQGRAQLRRDSLSGRSEWCCLGVLCDVAGPFRLKPDSMGIYRNPGEIGTNFGNDMPTTEQLRRWGLKEHLAQKLAAANDGGDSFHQIASRISRWKVEE